MFFRSGSASLWGLCSAPLCAGRLRQM
ncbi:GlyGly-CTERM sorting domain-containing protein [Lachnotalea sp. AF33-28]|nr:GlyGly-CTERM sorting domain-containing protein [Lachnotalea sp. AF33-28]